LALKFSITPITPPKSAPSGLFCAQTDGEKATDIMHAIAKKHANFLLNKSIIKLQNFFEPKIA
jgi:hypothetical protein